MSPAAPTGYGFVSLAPDVARRARAHAVWHRRVAGALFGCVEFSLCTEQPVHAGSGSKHAHDRNVVERGARIGGGPGIPGSSFKGVLRSRYEAITKSCAGRMPRGNQGEFEVRSSTGIQRARFAAGVPDPKHFDSRHGGCTETHICPACALFGRMSLRSRVTVTDLTCDRDGFDVATLPERFGPNLHHIGAASVQRDHRGDYFEVSTVKGRKFAVGRGPASESHVFVEVIPAGCTLSGQLRLYNVMPDELGGLLAALGREPASALKIGGGKAHGLGRVCCIDVRYRLVDARGAHVSDDEPAWGSGFTASEDCWSTGLQELVALHQGAC